MTRNPPLKLTNSGTYRRMCGLVGVDVVKIPGHKRKSEETCGNASFHACTLHER